MRHRDLCRSGGDAPAVEAEYPELLCPQPGERGVPSHIQYSAFLRGLGEGGQGGQGAKKTVGKTVMLESTQFFIELWFAEDSY